MPLIINGEEIDEDIVEGEFRQIKGHYERTLQVACCERDPEFRSMAKDNVVSRVLLNQEAQKRFAEVDEEEVSARLAKLIEEAGGETQFYMRIGLVSKDEAAVRPNVANGVRMDKMLAEVYQPEPEFSDDEMRAWHAGRADEFMTAEEIRAAHISKDLQGAQTRDEVYQHLRKVREDLLNGADFLETAERERGADQQQTDLGWFKRGEFMEEFEVIAFSMREGEISPVFTTQLGLHLCTLLGRKPSERRPFEEVREEVRKRMLEEYRDKRFQAFLEELKGAAEIQDTEPEEHH
jgi:parvulin-like peptidyl-prolyl isomerase